MFFTLKCTQKIIDDRILLKYKARSFILLCHKGITERLIDTYLIQNYHTNLVAVCLKIINNAQYNRNLTGDTVITIADKKLDKLASLITFGTGKLHGSNILKYAFGKI